MSLRFNSQYIVYVSLPMPPIKGKKSYVIMPTLMVGLPRVWNLVA